jgi:hypothetical protein
MGKRSSQRRPMSRRHRGSPSQLRHHLPVAPNARPRLVLVPLLAAVVGKMLDFFSKLLKHFQKMLSNISRRVIRKKNKCCWKQKGDKDEKLLFKKMLIQNC